MVRGFIAVLTMMLRGTWARLIVGAAFLCATVNAQAAELQIAGANSHGNSVYELTQSSGGLITGISALNTDAANHGSFKSIVWVPNAATGTLDLVVADTDDKQIVRYPGPNYTTGVALFTWHGLHQGPAEPDALAVDAAGDIFVVSSVCGSDVKASVWVLPVNKQGNYGAPVLIDDTFSNVMTTNLADTLIAGTTTPLWNAGDLLVLVGDSSDPHVMVYSQQAIAGVITNPSKPLGGPTSTAVPSSKFASFSAVPVGMDVWPADATHGISLLMTTTDGRILRFDTSANAFAANFASGLGSGLENIKTGAAAGVEYAFVSQEVSGYKGNILQFGAPPASGSNTPLATVSKGVSNPIGLSVTSSGSAPAQSCVSPDPACTFFGGGLTLEISGPGSKNISGNILEQSCVVQNDPRVTVVGTAWSCNGRTLDVSTLCPGFPSTILPGSLCGHSGPSGSGFVVLKGTADGVDPNDNNTQIVAQSNINAILPGPLNQNCNPVAAYAWAPRPDLVSIEGTIVEDALTPYFIELTGFCDEPGVIQRGASMTSFGLALNSATSGLPNGLPGYVDSKYTNLLATVNAASITPSVAANVDTYINDSETAFNNGVAGSPNGFSCAAYWADYADSYVRANLPAFSSNLTAAGGNPNPAFEISGRLANLFLTIETRAAGLPANTTWPPTSVPACVTLSAASASVPAGTATTLSWTALGVPTGSSCTLSGGGFANHTEPVKGSVSSGNLTAAGSPYTFDLVCPGTGTATSFDTATVKATAPPTAPVPNVVMLSQAAATTAITSAGLKVGTVTQQTSTTIPAGNVISQTPAAGVPAAIGSSVNLIVSSGTKVPNVVGSTQAAATTAIENAGLVVGTVTQQSSTTVAIGRVISESPLANTLASAGSAVNIVVSSGITVPNVVGSTQAAATAAITSAGLKLGTVTPQTSTTVPIGSVISQTPASGAAASGGSAVNLIVSSGTKVPNVVGSTQTAATTAIENAGLVVGTITPQASTSVAIGRVISESPLAGTLASAGSAVNIVVSSGTTVPNVVGSTQAAATAAITSAGLKLGTVTPQTSTTVPIGSVISQTPAAGSAASGGSAVNLIVSSGAKVPNVVGFTQAAATIAIDNAGLVLGTVTLQVSTTVPNGTVISESPLAGTAASAGSAVNIVVSSGTAVPNVVGATEAAATAAIQGAGLAVGTITQQASTTVPIGYVISESPLAGTVVSPGYAVALVVSSGTAVPNVVGATEAAATTAIQGAGLVLGTVTQQASTTVPVGNVISQSPLAGTVVSPGNPVALVISSGTAVPNVVGATQAAATAAIQGAGLVLGTVTQQASTTVPVGNVISQSPLAGTVVSPGNPVDIVVSSGPPPAITSFGSSLTSYTTASEALLNWTTTGIPSGDTCTLSATDGTYTTPTAVPANGAVYTGVFTTAGTYTATLNCPNVATPATLNLTISVPVPLYNLNALAISPTNQNLYATNQAGDLSFEGPGGQVLVYAQSPFGMIQQTAQTIGPALNSTTSLQYPSALAFDAAGNLYVADDGSDQIFVLSLSTTGAATLLNTINLPPITQGDESYNCYPVGLAVDAQGYLYVSCSGGYIGSSIYVFQNLNASTPLLYWNGDSNGGFTNMYGMALDGQSLLVGVSYDYETSQVVSYKLTDLQSVAQNAAGGPTALPAGVTIQPPPNNDPNPNGSSPYQVNIAVDSSANIYIASTYIDYAQGGIPYYPYAVASYSPIVYDPTTGAPSGATQTNPTTPTASTYLQPVPTLEGALAPSPLLTGPSGIALDVSANLYVVDPVNSTIDVYAASSGNYQYDFLPLITLTATPLDGGQYTLTWTSIGIEPSNASCLLTTSDGQYSATPEPSQNTTGVTLGSSYGTATLSCPGAIAFSYEFEGE